MFPDCLCYSRYSGTMFFEAQEYGQTTRDYVSRRGTPRLAGKPVPPA